MRSKAFMNALSRMAHHLRTLLKTKKFYCTHIIQKTYIACLNESTLLFLPGSVALNYKQITKKQDVS